MTYPDALVKRYVAEVDLILGGEGEMHHPVLEAEHSQAPVTHEGNYATDVAAAAGTPYLSPRQAYARGEHRSSQERPLAVR